MAFRNTRVTVGLIDQTVNSVDYVMQDSAGSFQTYMDTCQATGADFKSIADSRIANSVLPANYLDYAPTVISSSFDEIEQKFTKVLEYDSEGQYTIFRAWMQEILLDSAGTTGMYAVESNTTETV